MIIQSLLGDKSKPVERYLTQICSGAVKSEHFSSDVINLDWHDVSFQSGFRNYGGSYHSCQYAKDMFENVYLIGLAANSSTNVFDKPIFNLPEGYRPAQTVIFATPNTSSIGRIDIASNGDVKLSSAHGASSSFVSLNGIVFKAV